MRKQTNVRKAPKPRSEWQRPPFVAPVRSGSGERDDVRVGWTPQEWIAALPMRTSFLYAEWRRGAGPKSIKIRQRRIITEHPDDYVARLSSEQNTRKAA